MAQDRSQKIRQRVNRAVGQVEGVRRMVEEGRYCVDILNQIAAARSALDALGIELLTRHLEGCVLGQGAGHPKAQPMNKEELIEEVRVILSRFLS